MTTEILKSVLLTGAGFTHNFGGFLADQMWARILNHERVKNCPTLLTIPKGNFDFEAVYNQVMRDERYTQEDRKTLHEVVEDAYKKLDDTYDQELLGIKSSPIRKTLTKLAWF